MGIAVYNIYNNENAPIHKISENKYKTIKPSARQLKQEIEVDAQVVPLKEVKVSSEIPGRLEWIGPEEGDRVTEGQHIASIEHSELLSEINQAKARLEQAKAELAKARAGAREEDIEIARERLNETNVQVTASKTALASASRAATDTLDGQMLIVDKYFVDPEEPDAELNIQYVSSGDKNQIDDMRRALEKMIQDAHKIADSFKDADAVSSMSAESVLDSAKEILDTLGHAKDLSLKIDDAVSNALERLNRNNLKLAQADMQKVKPVLESERLKLDQSISALKIANAKYKQADVELKKLLAGTRKEDIDALEAAVKLAESSVSAAQSKLAKAIIKSPVSGTVSEVYKERGEYVSSMEPILSIITDGVFIKAQVPEVDISKVRIGMPVEIKFDAYKSKRFKGEVYFIYPSQKEINNIVYYEIKVLIKDPSADKYEILPGMTASVYIPSVNKDAKVTIPKNIVQKDEEGSYVMVLDSKAVNPFVPQKRYIKLGESDGKYVEVLSGLDLTDKVVLE